MTEAGTDAFKEGGMDKIWIILILTGFFQLGAGIIFWAKEHFIEKERTTQYMRYVLKDFDGNTLELTNLPPSFFEKYRIVKKEAQ